QRLDPGTGKFGDPYDIELSVSGDVASFRLEDYLVPLSQVDAAALSDTIDALKPSLDEVYSSYRWSGVRLESPGPFSELHTLRLDLEGRLAANDLANNGYASVSLDGQQVVRNHLLPRSTGAAAISVGATTGVPASRRRNSVAELGNHPVDVALPRAMEQLQLALGRGLPGLGDFHQRIEEVGLVHAVGIARRAPAQAGRRDLQRLDRQFAHRGAAERQLQRVPGHAVAQGVALSGAEVLDQI